MPELPPGILSEIIKQGLLGIALLGMCWVAWNLLGRLNTSQAELADAWKSLVEVISGNNLTLRDISASSDARTRSTDAVAEAQKLAAAAQLTLTQEVNRATQEASRSAEICDNLRTEVQRLREVLIKAGINL